MNASTASKDRLHPLVREIAIVLGLKALALLLLWAAFFGPADRPDVTTDDIGAMLFGAPPSASERNDGDA